MNTLRTIFVFTALLFVGVAVTAMAPSNAFAQEQQMQVSSEARAYFTPTVKEYGRPGYPKMTVYVWGNADSGVWSVEQGTDLLEFMSVVSRARMTDTSPDRRRIETLSIYRDQQPGTGDPFFETRIQELFAQRGSYPALKEGDVLVLETRARGRFTWRDIARVAGTVATLVNTYLIFQRIGDN